MEIAKQLTGHIKTLDPTRLGPADGNRTFELRPETVQGGALLLHGLTDGPYSVKPVAETLRKLGYYTLAPRMPGHGTAPAGLVSVEWQDWMSVVRLAARHVRGHDVQTSGLTFCAGGRRAGVGRRRQSHAGHRRSA